jgi:hypothetical protein
MALADLTPLTIMFEFVPPLVATLVYLLFFGKRRSKLIEAFIVVMYLKTVTWFLLNIALSPSGVSPGFNPAVDLTGFSWIMLTDALFQFTTALQEFLIWVMVSFFAVLFGMLVLALKLALQDPLKMKFSNLIKRIIKRDPVIDGYSGFSDRVEHIRFEGVEPQPLNPEVQSRAWRDAWKDYVIIGLATLIPSISVYVGGLPNFINMSLGRPYTTPNDYILNVLIFLTWIYRFGYPASNRIAKGAGLRLGDRDIGSEMMRGVLGWFFRLNILLSVGTIALQVYQAAISGVANVVEITVNYYINGLILAAPPILFVVLILPLVEDFAVGLYSRVFFGIKNAGRSLKSVGIGQVLKTLGVSVGAGLAVAGAYVASVFAATLNYAIEHGQFLLFPRSIDDEFIQGPLINPINNPEILGETVWVYLLLAIPFAMLILLGIVGHYVRKRTNTGIISFSFLSGVTLAVVTNYILPGIDYVVAIALTPADIAGEIFNRFRPIIVLPTAEDALYRLASQYIVNLPIFVFTIMFIMYFFQYRERWRETIGERAGPLLNVTRRDIYQSALMFFGGLAVAILGVWGLSQLMEGLFAFDPLQFRDLLSLLLQRIANPDGLEGVLPPAGGFLDRVHPGAWFVVFAEHNMVRILLMLVVGPVFWSSVLWYSKVRKTETEKNIGGWSIILLTLGGAVTYLWTLYDQAMLVFDPLNTRWGFAAQLGLRGLIVFGVLFLAYAVIALVKGRGGNGVGAWWFPLFITIFAAEYFVYDDQFTLIALVILPLFLAGGYKLFFRGRENVRAERFWITYIKFGFMSVAIAEVLSTALTLGGIAIIEASLGLNALAFLARVLPHAIVEIPTFIFAAAVSIRVARDLWPTIESEDWSSVPSRTRSLLGDERTWRTYVLIAFFLVIAALIEAFVTPIIFWHAMGYI